MKGAKNFASMSDPSHNGQFSRQWSEPQYRDGFKTIGEIAAEIVGHLPFQRKIERFHHLGPRVLGEMLAELGAERSIMTAIIQMIERYIELNPEVLEAAGGDDFSPIPIHQVRQP